MYEKLFSPVKIGRMEVKNRVAMTSMGVNLAVSGGGVNDDIVALYEGRSGRRWPDCQRDLPGDGRSRRGRGVPAGGQERWGSAGSGTADGRNTQIRHQDDSALHHAGRNYALGDEEPIAASAVEHPTPAERSVH